jgi:transcriptional regulator GlxA family with amidase domain
MDRIAAAPVVVDQWQLEKLALVAADCEVLFYVPGLPDAYHPSLWGRSFPSAADAVAALTAGLKPGARIAAIPEGPYVLARAGAREEEVVLR